MTESDDFEHAGLNDAMRMGIAALVSGMSVSSAAKAAGVSRPTLSTWKNRNAAFQEALVNRRNELDRERFDAIRALDAASIHCILEAVKVGDTKAALEWNKLRGIAAMKSAEPPSTHSRLEATLLDASLDEQGQPNRWHELADWLDQQRD